MKLLLDTHAIIWLLADESQLPPAVKAELLSIENHVYLSAISALELSLKVRIGKSKLPVSVGDFVSEGLRRSRIHERPLRCEHAAAVESLPLLHRDPFDRALVAQALLEGIPIVSADPDVARYGVEILW